jgi:cyclophilin family peptidyl-prolyl cis-trans isomerase
MVGMANSGADKNGSQFFITFNLHDYYLQSIKAANDNVKDEAEKMTDEQVEEEVQKQLETMSSNYTIFGKVTEGYEKAEALTSSDVILTIKIESKAK